MEWKPARTFSGVATATSLETSLVEWKHGNGGGSRVHSPRLGNFLSGMETERRLFRDLMSARALETSLVEWKPWNFVFMLLPPSALETSLVEWKLDRRIEWLFAQILGNFLSGMETCYRARPPAWWEEPWKLP